MVERSYHADDITVRWNSELCIHTAICLNALPQVFNTAARPWIAIEGASAAEIAGAVEKCPTGALTYERTDGTPGEQAPSQTTIIPWPNGPLMVRGEIAVRDAKGNQFTAGPRFTLCRCGPARTNRSVISHIARSGFVTTLGLSPPRGKRLDRPMRSTRVRDPEQRHGRHSPSVHFVVGCEVPKRLSGVVPKGYARSSRDGA